MIELVNFSEACERNKAVILEQLSLRFANCKQVLEIGSGSGQHALHFAPQLSHLTWQASDMSPYFNGLLYNLVGQHVPNNLLVPVEIDITKAQWIEDRQFDGLFSANSLHIMSWPQVEAFFQRSGKNLVSGAVLCIYGPFKYKGEYTSASNADFDLWLKDRDSDSGIRDIEAVTEQANANGFQLMSDTPMPANNQFLHFIKD